MKKQQSGFTLIELVVVIVILGILAATAIPRFASVTTDARKASINGLLGGVKSAMSLSHAVTLVNGTDTSASVNITMEGTTVAMVFGYPSLVGIASAMNATDGFSYASGTGIFDISPTAVANCKVTYVAATSSVVPATATATTTGC